MIRTMLACYSPPLSHHGVSDRVIQAANGTVLKPTKFDGRKVNPMPKKTYRPLDPGSYLGTEVKTTSSRYANEIIQKLFKGELKPVHTTVEFFRPGTAEDGWGSAGVMKITFLIEAQG